MQSWIQKWEYKALVQAYDKKNHMDEVTRVEGQVPFSGTLIQALNILGQQGWELADYTSIELGDSVIFNYILKRPAPG